MKTKIFFSLLVGFNLIFSFSQMSHAAEQKFIGTVKEHYELNMFFVQLLTDGENELIFLGASYQFPECITSAVGSNDRVEIIGDFIRSGGSLSLNLEKDYSCNPVTQNNSSHDESQDAYSTEAPIEISITQEHNPYINAHNTSTTYLYITSLVDSIVIENVIINRGNMLPLNTIFDKLPREVVFGNMHKMPLPNANVKEVKVITNQGAWIFNWSN